MFKEIRFNNSDRFEAGDDIHEFLDDNLIKELKNKKYITVEQQENYLLTEYGNRFYIEHNRSYTVIFKNGVTRVVQPSRNIQYNFDNSKLKNFIA